MDTNQSCHEGSKPVTHATAVWLSIVDFPLMLQVKLLVAYHSEQCSTKTLQ